MTLDVDVATTFDVDVARLALVPHMLDRLAEDADACVTYAGKAFDFPLGPGLINRATGLHADVRAATTGFLATISSRARGLSTSIDRGVRDYEKVDAETRAEFDAMVSAVDRPDYTRWDGLRLDVPQANMRPLNEPTHQLKALTDYRPQWPYEPNWADLVSPTNICRDVVMGVNWLAVQIGVADRIYDPLDTFTVPLIGDWARMKACSDALRNVSAACSELRGNCSWIELRVNAVWQGNAADAAWMRLGELGRYLDQGIPALDHFSAAYSEVVDEMAKLEEAMEIIVAEMIDYAVLALIAAATAETGVGPVLVGAAVVVKIAKTMERIGKAVSLIDALGITVDNFQGMFGDLGMLEVDLEGEGRIDYEKTDGVLRERI